MRSLIGCSMLAGVLLLLASAFAPTPASAQCVSPEHCHNLPSGGQFCEDGEAGWTWEECDEEGGFCQLWGGQCNPAFEYSSFAADTDLTAFGTLRTVDLIPLGLVEAGEFRNCQGLVVVLKDESGKRYEKIVI